MLDREQIPKLIEMLQSEDPLSEELALSIIRQRANKDNYRKILNWYKLKTNLYQNVLLEERFEKKFGDKFVEIMRRQGWNY